MTTRSLQINIFEGTGGPLSGAGAAPRSGRPGGSGSDPGDNYVMPPPGDPGDNYVMPPPSDPGDNYVMPPPSDPGDNYVMPPPGDPGDNYVMPPPADPSGDYPGYVTGYGPAGALVTAQYLPQAGPVPSCCCCEPCPDETTEPAKYGVSEGDHSGFVIVRLASGVGPLEVDSLWQLACASHLDALKAVLEIALDEDEIKALPPCPQADAGDAQGRRESPDRPVRGGGKDGGASPAPGVDVEHEPDGVLVSRPLVNVAGWDRKATVGAIRELEQNAAKSYPRPRHGLARYWRVDLRPYPELAVEAVAGFNALAAVDLAYRELRTLDSGFDAGDVTGETFAEDQSYFDPAPVGIGARGIQDLLGNVSSSLKLIDLEQGWQAGLDRSGLNDISHEQLQSLPHGTLPLIVYGENRELDEAGSGNHGTAVLGQLAAEGVGAFKVRGAVPSHADFQLASHYRATPRLQGQSERENPFPGTNGHVAAAIVNCLVKQPSTSSSQVFETPLGQGDVLLLEVQRGKLPTEIDEADLEAIQLATALGVIVIEAAGNGNLDLDRCVDPRTGRTLRRGAAGFVDSGAILVGASFSALPHDRAPFSNYGSRVDCYGWGEAVTSCGYGDLAGQSATDFYTNTFNGTSSASPIIAAAAALLQCLHLEQAKVPLLPFPMRTLLASRVTGTPQGPNVGGHIGVMPNLEAIVRSALQLVPDVYLRRSVSDDGSLPAPGDEISSSPDIVVSATTTNLPDLGEGSGTENDPSPGEEWPVGDGMQRSLHVRLRNRGTSAGETWVRLFASPAATLVVPERWTDLGAARMNEVPMGDTLSVSDALAWQDPVPLNLPAIWQTIFQSTGTGFLDYCFLAVVEDEKNAKAWAGTGPPPPPPSPLPPGGAYFDWAVWRAFLRRRGVAWRNGHRAPGGTSASLPFLLAGTLDQEREFDLEVIQRLPEGATSTLTVPDALAKRLQQRQPGLPIPLELPRRRVTRFSRVRLPRGLCAPACFDIQTATPLPLAAGHGLAIRQLWRGEEVGRITWHFGP